MLSLFCASASAEICLSFLNVTRTLFTDTLSNYEAAIEFFLPDADMKDAMIQLKSLVDTLPSNTTENILKFMVHSSLPSVPLSSGSAPPPSPSAAASPHFFGALSSPLEQTQSSYAF